MEPCRIIFIESLGNRAMENQSDGESQENRQTRERTLWRNVGNRQKRARQRWRNNGNIEKAERDERERETQNKTMDKLGKRIIGVSTVCIGFTLCG